MRRRRRRRGGDDDDDNDEDDDDDDDDDDEEEEEEEEEEYSPLSPLSQAPCLLSHAQTQPAAVPCDGVREMQS